MCSRTRRTLLPFILLAAQVACGSKGTQGSSAKPADGGAGGDSSGGRASTDGGFAATGDGGVQELGNAAERIEACIAWKVAQCQRGIVCGHPVHNCLAETLNCPDALFSPGSAWTATKVKACAEDFATLPCEAALQGRVPACAPRGTRGEDESCVFDSQCQSLSCPGGGAFCSSCAPSLKNGDSCVSNEACPPGAYCDKDAICRSFAGLSVDPPGPSLGMSCKESRICRDESYCDGEICQPLPKQSKPCGADPRDPYSGACAEGLVCDWFSMTCVPVPALGDACVQGPMIDAGASWVCADNHRCDERFTPPYKCASYESVACANSFYDCGSELVCVCDPDVINVYCSSRDRACRREEELLMAGAPCETSRNLCHPAFSCTNGHCTPRDAQEYFTELCENQ